MILVVALRFGFGVGSSGSAAVNYVGTTSQGLPISFSATATSVKGIQFGWEATCADGQAHTNTIGLGHAALSSGTFTASGVLDTGGQAAVSGRVAGATASGVLSRSGPTAFATNCTDEGVAWSARRLG